MAQSGIEGNFLNPRGREIPSRQTTLELREQVEHARRLWQEDRDEDRQVVFIPGALEREFARVQGSGRGWGTRLRNGRDARAP